MSIRIYGGDFLLDLILSFARRKDQGISEHCMHMLLYMHRLHGAHHDHTRMRPVQNNPVVRTKIFQQYIVSAILFFMSKKCNR